MGKDALSLSHPPMFTSHRTDSTFEEIPIMLVVSSTDQDNILHTHSFPLTAP